MPKFKKKPVEIEARCLTETNLEQLESWCGGQIKGIQLPREKRCVDIQTLEGEMRAEIGDWIIKGVEGEFYPCKPSVFNKTYDRILE